MQNLISKNIYTGIKSSIDPELYGYSATIKEKGFWILKRRIHAIPSSCLVIAVRNEEKAFKGNLILRLEHQSQVNKAQSGER